MSIKLSDTNQLALYSCNLQKSLVSSSTTKQDTLTVGDNLVIYKNFIDLTNTGNTNDGVEAWTDNKTIPEPYLLYDFIEDPLATTTITNKSPLREYSDISGNIINTYTGKTGLVGDIVTGLVAWYKFDGDFTDSSGNGYDITTNSATLNDLSYKRGSHSASFTSTQYAVLPTDTIKVGNITRENITICFWIKKNETLTSYNNYFSVDNGIASNYTGSIFFGSSQNGSTYIHVRYGGNTVDINTAFDNRATGVWNHYVFVLKKDGSNANIKFYVNGTEYIVYNSNTPWIELASLVKINRWLDGSTTNENIARDMDDFRIYNRALSETEVKVIYSNIFQNSIPYSGNTSALLAWYKFDGNFNDSSGNGNTLTNYNGTTIENTLQKRGTGCAYFNGSGQYCQLPVLNFGSGTAISFCCWFRFNETQNWSRIFDFGNGPDSDNIILSRYNSDENTLIIVILNGSTVYEKLIPNITNDIFYHISIVLIKGTGTLTNTLSIYLNGILVNTYTDARYPSNLTLSNNYIGKDNYNSVAPTGFFNGFIDDFRIYTSALTPEEVKQIYVEDKRYTGSQTGLICWYKFDNGIPDGLIVDSAGSRNLSLPLMEFPREAMTDFTKTYTNGTVVRVVASSYYNTLHPWRLFNNVYYATTNAWADSGSYSNGTSTSTTSYFNNDTTFHGQWVMIDLGEKIVLNNYRMFPLNGYVGRAPKDFRIYATNDDASYNNTKSGNWVLIDTEIGVSGWADNTSKTFTLSPIPQVAYRYYAMIVNKTNGNEVWVHLTGFDLYGNSDLNNAVLSTTDKMRGDSATRFVNTNSYYQVANTGGAFTPATLSICCWFKIKSISDTFQTIASSRAVGNYLGWTIYIPQNVTYIEFWTGDGTQWNTKNIGTFTLNTWTHLCITISNNSLKAYLNGVLSETSALPYSSLTETQVQNMRIGAGLGTPAYYLSDGSLIDDFRMYNRILTSTEVKSICGYTLTRAQGRIPSTYSYYWNGVVSELGDNSYITLPKSALDPIASTSNMCISYWAKYDNTENELNILNIQFSPNKKLTLSTNSANGANANSLKLAVTLLTSGTVVKYPKYAHTNGNNAKQSTTFNTTYQAYLAFDGATDGLGQSCANNQYSSGNALVNNGFTGYDGDWIMINTEESFILNKVKFFMRSTYLNRAPGVFRIYGTNDITLFNNQSFTSGWTLIHDQTQRLTDYVYQVGKEVTFSNDKSFSIYVMVVNKLSGTGTNSNVLNFTEWELYGLPGIYHETKWNNVLTTDVFNHYAFALEYNNPTLTMSLYKDGSIQRPSYGGTFTNPSFDLTTTNDAIAYIGAQNQYNYSVVKINSTTTTEPTIIDDNYQYFAFTSTTATQSIIFDTDTVCDIFMIGGGGGGGHNHGGGGGAGAYYLGQQTLTANTTYTITVGAGGAGATYSTGISTNGGDTTITGTGLSLLVKGGGGGASGANTLSVGRDGGCGGGGNGYDGINSGPRTYAGGNAVNTGTVGSGFAGGTSYHNYGTNSLSGGGGGGIGGVGSTVQQISRPPAGNGGAGKIINIKGINEVYGGGGGGGTGSDWGGIAGIGGGETINGTFVKVGGDGKVVNGTAGENGLVNTGSGGGSAKAATGGAGGSGIVIIKWARTSSVSIKINDLSASYMENFRLYNQILHENDWKYLLTTGEYFKDTPHLQYGNITTIDNDIVIPAHNTSQIIPYLKYDFVEDPTLSTTSTLTNKGWGGDTMNATVSNSVIDWNIGTKYTGTKKGLMAWFKFDGNYSDFSGNGVTLTPTGTGTLTFETDKQRGSHALKFPGATYLTSNSLSVNGISFTICFWSKVTIDTNNRFICSQGNNTYERQYLHIGYRTTKVFTFGFWGDTIEYFDANNNVNDNNVWIHWTMSYDYTTRQRKLYKNGVLVASNFAGGDPAFASVMRIGVGYETSNRINGNLDDFRVYNRVLKDSEITEIYGLYNALTSGIIAWYKFDGDFTDSSGNGYTLTPAGTGTLTFETDKQRGSHSLKFPGTGNLTSSSLSVNGTSFTICFWVKPVFIGTSNWILVQGSILATRKSLHIGYRSSTVFAFAFFYDDLDYNTIDDNNTWVHWTLSYDYSTRQRKMFKNGVLVASKVAQGDPDFNSSWLLGLTSSGNYFNGNLDEFRVYNRALSATEVKELVYGYKLTRQIGYKETYNYSWNNVVTATNNYGVITLPSTVITPITTQQTSINFSVSFWVKFDSLTESDYSILKLNYNSAQTYLDIGINDTTTYLSISNGSGATTYKTSWDNVNTIGIYNHYVYTFQYTNSIMTIKLYKNGLLCETNMGGLYSATGFSFIVPTPSSNGYLGYDSVNDELSKMNIEDFRIFDKTLNDNEIFLLFDPTMKFEKIAKDTQIANLQSQINSLYEIFSRYGLITS